MNLPEELLEEILIRLPPKSITRCKSVCKSWSFLVTSKKFINNHLELSTKRTKDKNNPCTTLVLGWTCPKLPDDLYEVKHDIPRKQKVGYATLQVEPGEFSGAFFGGSLGYHPSILFGSHCNGIICLVNSIERTREKITFLNPTIEESIEVWSKPVVTDDGCDFLGNALGFGYDSRADDYKYVKILYKDDNFSECKVEVYSLGSGCWRAIKAELVFNVYGTGVYLKGFLYWVDYKDDDSESIIVFDLSEEKFRRILLPSQVAIYLTIMVWNESIVLVSFPEDTKPFGMLILNNDGVTWTENVAIDMPRNTIGMPVLFWKDDELLLHGREGFLSYNLSTKGVTKFPLHHVMYTAYADVFVESLVSVKPKL